MNLTPDRTDNTADACFKRGDLAGARTAAAAAVKDDPKNAAARLLMAELCLFDDDLARAETLVAALTTLDPGMALVASEFRQLLRAETQRRAVLDEGAMPEFIGEPTASMRESLRALTALRAGDAEGAAAAVEAAENLRTPTSCTHSRQADTVSFDDFRDADDILGGAIEVLTTTGKCFWVPLSSVIELSFHTPLRPRDLFWRRATMSVRNGPEGDVYLPAIYYPAGETSALRLGRETEWSDGNPVRGKGQRLFLAGEDALEILAIETLSFD